MFLAPTTLMQLGNFHHEIHISSTLLEAVLAFYGQHGNLKLQQLEVTFDESEERPFVDRVRATTGLDQPQCEFRKTYTKHLRIQSMIPRNILFILQKLIQPTQTLEILTFKKDLVIAHEGDVSPQDTKWLEA